MYEPPHGSATCNLKFWILQFDAFKMPAQLSKKNGITKMISSKEWRTHKAADFRTFGMPDSSCRIICVFRAILAENGVGRPRASSNELVWRDCVPPNTAAIASIVVLMMLLYGSCSKRFSLNVQQRCSGARHKKNCSCVLSCQWKHAKCPWGFLEFIQQASWLHGQRNELSWFHWWIDETKEKETSGKLKRTCSVKDHPDVWLWHLSVIDFGFFGLKCFFIRCAQSLLAARSLAISWCQKATFAICVKNTQRKKCSCQSSFTNTAVLALLSVCSAENCYEKEKTDSPCRSSFQCPKRRKALGQRHQCPFQLSHLKRRGKSKDWKQSVDQTSQWASFFSVCDIIRLNLFTCSTVF